MAFREASRIARATTSMARTMTPWIRGDRHRPLQVRRVRRRLSPADRPEDRSKRAPHLRTRRAPALERHLAGKLHSMMRPRLQTTIATGPGPLDVRVASFSFFSPSRFATYRCRLTGNGKPEPWRSCPGGFVAFAILADGDYRFEVAGVIEGGRIDRTPASRSFTLSPTRSRRHAHRLTRRIADGANRGVHVRESTPGVGVPVPAGPAERCPLQPGRTFNVQRSRRGSYRFDVWATRSRRAISDPAAGWFFRVDTTGPE